MKRRLVRIAQPRACLVRLLGERGNQAIGRLRPADARKVLADDPVLALERIEHLGDRRHCVRRGEQPKGVAGRRRVDDHYVVDRGRGSGACSVLGSIDVAPDTCQPADLDQRRQLVDAGNRQTEERVDVLAIEPGPVFEDVAERLTVALEPATKGSRRIELDGMKSMARPMGLPHFGAHASGYSLHARRQPNAQHVAERMRWIGRHNEHALGACRRSNGGRGRARGLSDAAFAAVEDEMWWVTRAGYSFSSSATVASTPVTFVPVVIE